MRSHDTARPKRSKNPIGVLRRLVLGTLSACLLMSNADAGPILVTGAGPGAGPHVRVFDMETGQELLSFYAYDAGFRGGVRVAAGARPPRC